MLKAKAFDGVLGSDVEEQMNKFFKQNPNLREENMQHLQLKMGRAYNTRTGKVDTHVTALIVYDETRMDKATRGTQ